MSPGQTGHITGQMGRVPGTDGTHTRGCPAKILYVYWSNDPIKMKEMKGAFCLNNLLVGTVRPPEEGGFQIAECAAFFFAWKSVIAREFLPKIDTSLAIATSGLRINLLFEKKNLSENPPLDFPNSPEGPTIK